ncbi:MAG: queuosine precursor transporter [Nanoarchaeota archaeon]
MKLTKTEATIILSGMYLFFSLAANIAATKITFFGSLVMDAGFIYALTFTWRDLIHKQLGKEAAITTIFTAGFINMIAALYFQFVILLPSQPEWAAAGGQAAWQFLFSLQLRIVIASVVTQIIAELADTQTYSWWTSGFGAKRPQWMRVVVSNAISIPIDSFLFPIIAFAGVVSPTLLFQMFLTNLAVKAIVTGLSFWMIYLVPEKKIYHSED